MWVRGLKLSVEVYLTGVIMSHPVWVRGLKLWKPKNRILTRLSHPVWVRGLKPKLNAMSLCAYVVAPRVGAWIETSLQKQVDEFGKVAPRVGAWIETDNAAKSLSIISGRTPCGCVD